MSREETMSDDDGMSADMVKEDKPEPVPQAFWECLKPATSTIECGKAFSFDPIGDLTIRVGEDGVAYEFVVCSRTLSRWSPVFRTMLYRGFAESRPADAAWSVSLPDDLPSSMFLVLSIIHGCFEHVPTSLSQIELYQTLAVTEKYDMTKIVRPWATTWYAPYKDISQITGNELLLWISWELGYENIFCLLAKDLILSSYVNDDGELISKEGVVLSSYSYLQPPNILENIAKGRQKLTDQIITWIYAMTDAAFTRHNCAAQPDSRKCSKCKSQYPQSWRFKNEQVCPRCKQAGYTCQLDPPSPVLPTSMCGSLVFGSLVQEVKRITGKDFALMKEPKPHFKQSIDHFSRLITTMWIDLPSEHEACNPLPAVKEKIRLLVQHVPSPATEQHLEYMRNQAKKTGIV